MLKVIAEMVRERLRIPTSHFMRIRVARDPILVTTLANFRMAFLMGKARTQRVILSMLGAGREDIMRGKGLKPIMTMNDTLGTSKGVNAMAEGHSQHLKIPVLISEIFIKDKSTVGGDGFSETVRAMRENIEKGNHMAKEHLLTAIRTLTTPAIYILANGRREKEKDRALTSAALMAHLLKEISKKVSPLVKEFSRD